MSKANNIVESLASSVYSAIAKDLPDVKYKQYNPRHKGLLADDLPMAERRPYADDLDVYHFPQMWGSTALGFGGMGGSAMTEAYTTVVICKSNAAVYFDGRLAYVIDKFLDTLMIDIRAFSIKSVDDRHYYMS